MGLFSSSLVEDNLTSNAEQNIERIIARHPKTQRMWDALKDDPYVNGLWEMSDYIVKYKMHFNDHGDTHAKVVASNALKILDILVKKGISIDTVHDGIGDLDDAYLIIMTAGLLHDIGNQVKRGQHYVISVILSIPILDHLLSEIYGDPMKRAMVRGSILHCIGTHMEDVKSYTLEASIIKIADGTDITKGRSRLDFDPESINIHTVSASSIGEVIIAEGRERPVVIRVRMINSAGVFQVQEILCKKLQMGVVSPYIEIEAITMPPMVTSELKRDERIVHRLLVLGDKFMHITPFQRYLGNSRSREIHDLTNTKKTCRIDQIKDDNKVFFGSIGDVETARDQFGYEGCKWCLPYLKRGTAS
jgi:metal-dependent HD superfamily phosphatase/phosphodiesterase